MAKLPTGFKGLVYTAAAACANQDRACSEPGSTQAKVHWASLPTGSPNHSGGYRLKSDLSILSPGILTSKPPVLERCLKTQWEMLEVTWPGYCGVDNPKWARIFPYS